MSVRFLTYIENKIRVTSLDKVLDFDTCCALALSICSLKLSLKPVEMFVNLSHSLCQLPALPRTESRPQWRLQARDLQDIGHVAWTVDSSWTGGDYPANPDNGEKFTVIKLGNVLSSDSFPDQKWSYFKINSSQSNLNSKYFTAPSPSLGRVWRQSRSMINPIKCSLIHKVYN